MMPYGAKTGDVKRYTDRLTLLLMLLLSAGLLFHQLDRPSLSVDEFVNVGIDVGSVFSILHKLAVGNDLHPPLSHVVSSFWTGVFGQHEWTVRSIWALVGVFTVAATYRLGRELASSRTGVLSALLVCCLSTFLLYTRFVKYYSLTMCLAVLLALAFISWYERPLSSARLVPYGVLLLLYLYTDYFGPAMWVVFSNLVVLARFLSGNAGRRTQPYVRWVVAQGCVVLGWLPWIGFAGRHTSVVIHGLATADMTSGLFGTLIKVVYGLYSFSVGETLFPWHLLAVLGGAAVAVSVLGSVHVHRGRGLVPSVSWAAMFSTMSIVVVGVLLSTLIQGVPFVAFANHILFALPFYSVWLASGILKIRSPRFAYVVLAMVLSMRIEGLINYFAGAEFHNPIYAVPTREIVEDLAKSASPDDLVIAAPDTGVPFYVNRLPYWNTEIVNPFEGTEGVDIAEGHWPDRIWLFVFGRDRTRSARLAQVKMLIDSRCALEFDRGFAEQAPLYRRMKTVLFERSAYRYKLSLYVYDCTRAD